MKRFMIIKDGENNHYDDSDFYYIAWDIKEEKIIKHIHSSTRYAGFDTLEDSKKCQDEELEKYLFIAKKWAHDQVNNRLDQGDFKYDAWKGDTVMVVNERARKFKGEEFIVTHYYQYTFNSPIILCGENGIKSSQFNCVITKLSQQHRDFLEYQYFD